MVTAALAGEAMHRPAMTLASAVREDMREVTIFPHGCAGKC
jgi:hypothetical protein